MRAPTLLKLVLGFTLLVAVPAVASAQTQYVRTWVSGLGDDVNPCNRLNPCKTLAGAISKTAAGGSIGALDPGGFGDLTIVKPVTIDLRGAGDAGISVGTITVNAPDARVSIRGVNMNGFGIARDGIRIIQARSVKIADTDIHNFTRNGVSVESKSQVTRVVVKDSTLRDNTGNGVLVAPVGVRTARVTLRRNNIDDNGCGVAATRFGAAEDLTVRCGTGGTTDGAIAVVNAFGNSISDSARQGFLVNGSSATVRIARNEVTGSALAPALVSFNAGDLLSFGNNFVTGNPGGNGAPTGNAEPQM